MHEYEKKVLDVLKVNGSITQEDLISKSGLNKDSVLWALQNLELEELISIKKSKIFIINLNQEALNYLNEFPEEKIAKLVLQKGSKEKLNIAGKENNIGLIWAKKNNWINIHDGNIELKQHPPQNYWQRDLINELKNVNEYNKEFIEKNKEALTILIKRKLIEIKEKNIITNISITQKGINASEKLIQETENEIKELTKEFITNYKEDKKFKFKKYNINAPTDELYPATMHPISLFINKIRRIFFEFGFQEISGPIVDSEFWIFDALFSPQDHPTRELQDTFFLSNPKELDINDKDLTQKIKKMHEKNWRGKWQIEIAKRAILRTHTTSVSAHYIRNLANATKPIKLFTIGKIFRNESIDFKHLAEFHQADGIIISDNLNLSNLIFILKRIYEKLNINVKVKPSYFPFVEPGLEINYIDKKTNETIELGGAGIIRDEIKNALGLKNKEVLAFGLGIERLIFNELPSLSSLIELYKNDIGWLRNVKQIKT